MASLDRQCAVCGATRRIEVHHIDHDHGNDDARNLIDLCGTCHDYVTRPPVSPELAHVIAMYERMGGMVLFRLTLLILCSAHQTNDLAGLDALLSGRELAPTE